MSAQAMTARPTYSALCISSTKRRNDMPPAPPVQDRWYSVSMPTPLATRKWDSS